MWQESVNLKFFDDVVDKMFSEKEFKSRMSIGFGSDDTIKKHSNRLHAC